MKKTNKMVLVAILIAIVIMVITSLVCDIMWYKWEAELWKDTFQSLKDIDDHMLNLLVEMDTEICVCETCDTTTSLK